MVQWDFGRLTFVNARGDTKPLAKELLRRYKTVYGLLHADPNDLLKVPGVGKRTCQLLALVRDTTNVIEGEVVA